MPLSETKIRAIKASGKTQKVFDGRGLFLLVSSKGSKCWRFKYRFNNKEKLLALGTYPDVSLIMARDRHYEACKQLRNGIDPSEYRKAMKAAAAERRADTFELIAREWFAWYSIRSEVVSSLERDIFPKLGNKPITEITTAMLFKLLCLIEARGAVETARRISQYCSRIFRYAIVLGRAEHNPALGLMGGLSCVRSKPLAAETDPKRFGVLLRAIDSYKGTLTLYCALRLVPLVFVNSGELRTAQWADINFEKAEWRFLITKTNTPHIVPLSTQAVAILQEIQPSTGNGRYVFPSTRNPDKPMHENALLDALRESGISKEEASIHGFRVTARTLLYEVLGFNPDFIERQLAYAVRDPNERAYNRTTFLADRKKMMQVWADYCDALKQCK